MKTMETTAASQTLISVTRPIHLPPLCCSIISRRGALPLRSRLASTTIWNLSRVACQQWSCDQGDQNHEQRQDRADGVGGVG